MSSHIELARLNVKIETFFNVLSDIKINIWEGHTVSSQTEANHATYKEVFRLFDKILKKSPDVELIRVKLKGLEEPQNNENFNKLLQNLQSRIEEPANKRSDQQKQNNKSEQSSDDSLENKDSASKEHSADFLGQKSSSKQNDEKKDLKKTTEKPLETNIPPTNPKPVRKVRKLTLPKSQETSNQSKSLLVGGTIGLMTGIVATSALYCLFPSKSSDLNRVSFKTQDNNIFDIFGTPEAISHLNKTFDITAKNQARQQTKQELEKKIQEYETEIQVHEAKKQLIQNLLGMWKETFQNKS